MANTLGSLFIDLRANLAGFESDMGRASRIAQKEARELQKVARQFESAVRAGVIAAAGVAAIAVKGAIDRADEMDELIQKIGGSAESLSRLQFGAQYEGVDDLTGSLVKLSKAAVDADKDTSDQAVAFKALGIETRDAAGQLKTADVLLREIVGVFGQAEDGIAKTNIALALFGKSGADLIPFLNNGAEGLAKLDKLSDQLGLTLSGQTIEAARDFNDQMFTLGAASRGFGAIMAAELLPTLKIVGGSFVGAAKDSEALRVAAKFIGEVFKVLVVLGSEVAFVFKGVGTEIGGIAAQLAALAVGDVAGFKAIRQAMVEDAEAARKAQDEFTKLILEGKKEYAVGSGDIDQALIDQEVARAGKIKLIFNNDVADRKKAYDEQLKAAKKFAEDMASYDATLLDADANVNKEVRKEIADSIKQLGVEMRSPIEVINAQMTELNRLRDRAAGQGTPLDPEVYGRAVFEIQHQFADMSKTTQTVTDEMSVYADQAARNMQSSFADTLFDWFEGRSNNMLQSFVSILRRMAAEAAAAQIFEGIGAFASGIGTIGIPEFAPIDPPPSVNPYASVGAKSASMLSGLGSTSSAEVNVYNSSGTQATVQKSMGGNGREIVDVLIGEVNKNIAEGGSVATTLRGAYGLQRRPGGG